MEVTSPASSSPSSVENEVPVFPSKAPNAISGSDDEKAKKAARIAKMLAGAQKYREWRQKHKVDPKKLKAIRAQRSVSETTLRGMNSNPIKKMLTAEGIKKPTKHAVEGFKAAGLNFLESVIENVLSTRAALQKESKTISAREIYDELKLDPMMDGVWIKNPEFGKPLKKRKKEVQDEDNSEATDNEDDDEEEKEKESKQPQKKKQKKSPSSCSSSGKKKTKATSSKKKTTSKSKSKSASKSKPASSSSAKKSKTPSKKKSGKWL